MITNTTKVNYYCDKCGQSRGLTFSFFKVEALCSICNELAQCNIPEAELNIIIQEKEGFPMLSLMDERNKKIFELRKSARNELISMEFKDNPQVSILLMDINTIEQLLLKTIEKMELLFTVISASMNKKDMHKMQEKLGGMLGKTITRPTDTTSFDIGNLEISKEKQSKDYLSLTEMAEARKVSEKDLIKKIKKGEVKVTTVLLGDNKTKEYRFYSHDIR